MAFPESSGHVFLYLFINITMCDYQESVTTGQTDRQTDAGQSYPYVPLCFAGNTKRICNKIMQDNDFLFHCYACFHPSFETLRYADLSA